MKFVELALSFFLNSTDLRLIFVKYISVGYSSDDRFVRALGFRLFARGRYS